MKNKLWEPTKNNINDSQLVSFINRINSKYNLEINTFNDIHLWSVNEVELFWKEAADFLNIKFTSPPERIVDDALKMPEPLGLRVQH